MKLMICDIICVLGIICVWIIVGIWYLFTMIQNQYLNMGFTWSIFCIVIWGVFRIVDSDNHD